MLITRIQLPPAATRLAVTTLGRLLSRLDGVPHTHARPPGPAGLAGMAVDGKTLRGGRTAEADGR